MYKTDNYRIETKYKISSKTYFSIKRRIFRSFYKEYNFKCAYVINCDELSLFSALNHLAHFVSAHSKFAYTVIRFTAS